MLRTRLESCKHPLQPNLMCLAGQLSTAYTLLKHCKENKEGAQAVVRGTVCSSSCNGKYTSRPILHVAF